MTDQANGGRQATNSAEIEVIVDGSEIAAVYTSVRCAHCVRKSICGSVFTAIVSASAAAERRALAP